MFRRLFLVFLVFLGMGPHVWAEGITPLISANEEFKEWNNKDYIKEYQWDVNTPFNMTDFREKNPCKVYSSLSFGYLPDRMMPLASSHY